MVAATLPVIFCCCRPLGSGASPFLSLVGDGQFSCSLRSPFLFSAASWYTTAPRPVRVGAPAPPDGSPQAVDVVSHHDHAGSVVRNQDDSSGSRPPSPAVLSGTSKYLEIARTFRRGLAPFLNAPTGLSFLVVALDRVRHDHESAFHTVALGTLADVRTGGTRHHRRTSRSWWTTSWAHEPLTFQPRECVAIWIPSVPSGIVRSPLRDCLVCELEGVDSIQRLPSRSAKFLGYERLREGRGGGFLMAMRCSSRASLFR